MNLPLRVSVWVCLAVAVPGWAMAGDWPQFRGLHGDGRAEGNAPLHWSAQKNVQWRAALPAPGNSSPIVSNGKVFVTCAQEQGTKRNLHCFDRQTGRELWVRTVEFGKIMPTHNTNPHGASTPAADGQRVVVWHGSAGLYCYDFEGRQLWSKDLGEFRHMWGYAASPILQRGRVFMNCGPGRRVFVTAIDLATGRTLWETDEPVSGNGEKNDKEHPIGSWTTPVVAAIEGREQLVCSMLTRVNSYDLETGRMLWSCDGLKGNRGELAYSSPLLAGDLCVAIGGYQGPSIGFKPGGSGNITATRRVWRNESNPQSIGSGVYAGKVCYVPDAGPNGLRCLDPATGKVLWESRSRNKAFWGSIVQAGERLYVTNQEGETIVFEPNADKYVELAVNRIGEPSNATPAISDGQIFLRTAQALYCIAEAQ